jgi:recombinational DNA repair protein RecR
MYYGQVDSPKRINLLYDDVTRHYYLINNLTGAMANRFVCEACNKGCYRDVTHICDRTCSDCKSNLYMDRGSNPL